MANVPGQSIKEWSTIKPSSFAAWCLLCEVKKADLSDVYLELETAQQNGIGKSAYYFAFTELESRNWIKFSRHSDGKKWWKLVKGFERNSANVEKHDKEDSINVENSANVEKHDSEDSINVENSANVEFYAETPVENSANVEKVGIHLPDISANVENSANVELRIRNKEQFKTPQETKVSFGEEEEVEPPPQKKAKATRSKPQTHRLPQDYPLTDEMIDWAKKELPDLHLIEAHENFVEHWSNRTDAKSERVDWNLTWKKGMRLAFKWQTENGVKNGNGKQENQTRTSNGQSENYSGNGAKTQRFGANPVIIS